MKRRTLLATIAAGLAMPAVRSQAAARQIGWISSDSPQAMAPFVAAFRAGLAANLPAGAEPVEVVVRHASGAPRVFAEAVAELQATGVRLIVAQGQAAVPVVQAAPSVAVVFAYSGDPVMAGIAQSLARPGGNATGVTFLQIELMPKRVDHLRALAPSCRRIAVISNQLHPGEEMEIEACRRAVSAHGIALAAHRVQSGSDVAAAAASALAGGAEAVLALPSALMVQQAPVIAGACTNARVPLISGWTSIARAGALLTYGPNFADAFRHVARIAVRVLDGAPAGSLPVEQPTTFELAINTATATTIGLGLPPTLLALADVVIE